MYGPRIERWQSATDWLLTTAAILFLIAYATQILAEPTGVIAGVCEVILYVTWGVFLIDYVVRLAIVENRGRWFVRHLLDLAIVVLPMLRPLRLMRFLAIIAIFQRGAGNMLRGRVVMYTVGATILTVVIAGLAVYDAERANGNIDSFGDAMWWAFVTITTVGYGDYYPVTIAGRVVAVGLMIGGIALIGVVTATLASWIVERVSDAASQQKPAATEEHVESLRREIADLKELVRGLVPAK
ncbi:potassium channel family protein [Microbacterium sp.]|jgi:voltage-gated potassium channel|uniref:potassium channel family protein n=1 Tax=Microbacterium sp. TaxID=51671 RepID=UPI0037C76C2D